MTDLLLRLLGANVSETVKISGGTLTFRGASWGWIVLSVLIAAGMVYFIYRFNPVRLSTWRRYTLVALRVLFLGLILLLFVRPVLSLTVEGSVRRLLAVLIDSSASMRIQDPRTEPVDRKRAALGYGLIDPGKGLSQELNANQVKLVEQLPRVDLVKGVLKNPSLNLVPRLDKEFDLSAFSFGQNLVEISLQRSASQGTNRTKADADGTVDWLARLQADSPVTALGDAFREVLNRKRGQPLAGMLVVTDGANNSGSQPRDAANLLRQEGVPLFIYGVGITSPRDVIVANLFAPEVTFVRDEVGVTVRVRAQGLAGQSGELALQLDQEVVARTTVKFIEGEQVIPLQFTPSKEGEFELTATMTPRNDETVRDNNSRSQRLRVIDAKINVLMIEQAPRWEFRYLQAMLLRDRRIELKCFLVEGDAGIARGTNSPYLAQFPARKDDLFKYDLVVFGDVDPKHISAAQWENLNELVSRFGGALVLVAGKRWSPNSYRRGMLEKMLPVEYETGATENAADTFAEKPIHLELTAAGQASPMLRLSDNEKENAALWKQLPPVYWVARVIRPKPAAEVLLVDPDPAKETRFGKMPVMAVQQYGLGQVMYVGTDNTWRWRKNAGDLYYTALWGQIAQRVSLQRLMGVSKRTQLTTDRQNYTTGDRVTVYARLYSAGFEPLQEPAVPGLYGLKNGQGPRPEVILRPIPEQPGLYRGEFVAPAEGAYQFFIQSNPEVPLDFNVTAPKFEFGETAMNESLLRDLARETGGQFFREENLNALPDAIRARSEKVQSPLEVELWASPLYFLLLLGLVTSEWILRKMSHLK